MQRDRDLTPLWRRGYRFLCLLVENIGAAHAFPRRLGEGSTVARALLRNA
ncbi:hypothetical protein PHAMO_30017 [Magnetospirillum molischianum DSM 120]|uniref:Uncharacterized protein n=1 Tax=Magnetospirillum molischianum DSM 120 TaxID=1150626 RepID=H8FU23_MAGML|nr:hypothetical protein PHAMO_30017 [Magnetospirillum molischianum DSM 120]